MSKVKKVLIWLFSFIFTLSAAFVATDWLYPLPRGGGGSGSANEPYRTRPLAAEAAESEESMATLNTLRYNGTDIRSFTPNSFVGTHKTDVLGDTAVYRVELPSGTTEIPTVTAGAAGSGNVEVIDATDLSNPATSNTFVKVTEGNVVHYYKLAFTVASIPADAVYKQDFNDPSYDASVWKAYARNSASERTGLTVAVNDGALAFDWSGGAAGDSITYDTANAFNGYNKMLHAKVKFTKISGQPRFGIMAPGKDSQNYQLAEINDTAWMWENNASWGPMPAHNVNFKTNVVYDFAVKTSRESDGNIWMRIYLDGSKVVEWKHNSGSLNDAEEHHFGFRTWYASQAIEVDDLYVTADMPEDPAPPAFTNTKEEIMPDEGTYETIASDSMKVVVGSDFPFVYRYTDADGNFLANGIEPLAAKYNKKLIVNGNTVNCVPEQIALTADSITYKLTVNDYDGTMFAAFTVELRVTGNRLRLEFIKIEEAPDTIVKTFSLSNYNMASLRGDDAQAAIGQAPSWGPLDDVFVNLADVVADGMETVNSYTLLNDSRVSVAVESNALDGQQKFTLVKQADTIPNYNDEYVRRLGVQSTQWAWSYYNKSMAKLPRYEVPFFEVCIGGDENGDFTVDWHDAALAYRNIMVKPFKYEDTKDYYTYIAFNMSGMANNPSLRILDRAKALSYVTDGFGQRVMNKGYQVGGHDDSHGDYDNVSLQQGGIKDFEYLSKRGADYNIKTGIHFNATEFPLDGFETVLENMSKYPNSLQPNWSWLDQAYIVDKNKDVYTGELERRVSELGAALPNLDFVYVDVYQSGSGYTAKALQSYFERYGYSLMTEAAGDFVGDVVMHHWNTDLYYSVGGRQSEINRFIYNDLADNNAPNRALLGMIQPGVAQWKDSNFNEGVETFYRNNLATKYLQYFELQNWVKDQSATFEKNVRTEVTEESGKFYFNLYKDDLQLAKIDVTDIHLLDYYTDDIKPAPARTGDSEVFIPWSPVTEEKIYYWNDVNEESTWSVPLSWAGTETAYLYKLTTNGRQFVGEVPVTGGQVTITADTSTPYLLSKEQTDLSGLAAKRLPKADDNWGEGSVIQNFGFSGGTLAGWSATGDPTVHSEYRHSYPGGGSFYNKGDALVEFTDAAGALNQTLTVEDKSTYSFSVWAYTENRNVTLRIKVGDKTYARTIRDTHTLNMPLDPNKYKGTRFQRIEVDAVIPEGITTIQLELSVEAGAGTVLADDFRAWQWPTPASELPDESYLVKENFENVDEQHGPFVAFIGGEPGFHLAQRDLSPNAKQIKDYVIDGEWSLKDPVTNVGLHMRTVPSTLQLDRFMGQYKFSMDYMVFKEARHVVGQQITAQQVGYNMPTNAVYSVKVHRKDGTVISTYNLRQSTFESADYTYNSRPSVEHLEFFINANDLTDDGSYIAVYLSTQDTTSGTYESGGRTYYHHDAMLIMDNVEVVKMRRDGAKIMSYEAPEEVALQQGEGLAETVTVKTDSLGEVTLPVSYSGFDPLLTGVTQVVTAKIETLDYFVNSGVATTYTLRVRVEEEAPVKTAVFYTKPGDRVVSAGGTLALDETIAVTLDDGSVVYLPVAYTALDTGVPGVKTITGTIDTTGYETAESFSAAFTLTVQVVAVQPAERTAASYAKPGDRVVEVGGTLALDKTIAVTLDDGSIAYLSVTYSAFDTSAAGIQTVTGTIDTTGYKTAAGFASTFTLSVQVVGEVVIPEPEKVSGTLLGLGLGLGIPTLLLAGGALTFLILSFIKQRKAAGAATAEPPAKEE